LEGAGAIKRVWGIELGLRIIEYKTQTIVRKLRTEIRNRESKTRRKGFSLIELLLVLFIIGLAVALTAPAINTGLNRLKVKGAAKYLATTLKYARNQAISEKTRYYVRVNPLANKVTLMHDDTKVEKELKVSEDIVKIVQVIGDKKIEPSESITIVFYPRGNSSGGILEIWDQKGAPGYRLTIESSNGKIRIDNL